MPAHTGLQPVPCTRVTHMLATHQQALLPLGTEPRVTAPGPTTSPASRWVRAPGRCAVASLGSDVGMTSRANHGRTQLLRTGEEAGEMHATSSRSHFSIREPEPEDTPTCERGRTDRQTWFLSDGTEGLHEPNLHPLPLRLII